MIFCSSLNFISKSLSSFSFCVVAICDHMPAKKNTKKAGGKKESNWVPTYKFFAKQTLAPYPNEDGSALFYGDDCDKEKDIFKAGAVAKGRSGENCMQMLRVGMGVTLAAAAADIGGKTLTKRFGKLSAVTDGEEFQAAIAEMEKTGLLQLAALYKSAEGESFLEAAATLNVGKTGKPTRDETDKACETYFQFLDANKDALRKVLPQVASFAAKLYQHAMAVHETVDLTTHKKVWTKSLKKACKKPSKEVKAWVKEPAAEDKFLAAMQAEVAAKVKQNKGKKDRSDSSSNQGSDDNDSDDAKSSAAAESDSSKKSSKSSKSAKSDGSEKKAKKKNSKKGQGGKKRKAEDKKEKKAKKCKKGDSSDNS